VCRYSNINASSQFLRVSRVPRGRILWSRIVRRLIDCICSSPASIPSPVSTARQATLGTLRILLHANLKQASKEVPDQDPTSARFSRKELRHSAVQANQTSALPILEQTRPLLWPPFCVHLFGIYIASSSPHRRPPQPFVQQSSLLPRFRQLFTNTTTASSAHTAPPVSASRPASVGPAFGTGQPNPTPPLIVAAQAHPTPACLIAGRFRLLCSPHPYRTRPFFGRRASSTVDQ
jgi:hypothetical protein